ncbi:hypothetical protein SAMN04490185_5666 [Pseudomonas frederiksbergensis]|uniref:Uncharacterized protein n=1 Tax=Pseudomonas frederiksbergensis TaxID=104087 RepID=A0A1H5IK78_9PSED|nr:hypothetical protein [Pseudomonas frederiksbergensis]SEE40271.1 hypothetical protein SAMN04490185_5666 [Pseudomonas frederiksbergensis]
MTDELNDLAQEGDQLPVFNKPPSPKILSPVSMSIVNGNIQGTVFVDVKYDGYRVAIALYVSDTLIQTRYIHNAYWGNNTFFIETAFPGPAYLKAWGTANGVDSDPEEVEFYVSSRPVINTPEEREIVSARRPVIEGVGGGSCSLRVMRSGTNEALSDYFYNFLNTWSIKLNKDLSDNAEYSITIEQSKPGYTTRFSSDRTFITRLVPEPPVITSPAPRSLQETTFVMGGRNGMVGATVHVLLEGPLPLKEVGKSTELTSETWTASVTVKPGPVSLVAKQVKGTKESVLSTAVGFYIRPPKLMNIQVENLATPGSVKFSGAGYDGATVEITIKEPEETAPPPVVQVRNGQWETTATNWTFGTYKLTAVQKVPDNANGWIPSLSLDFDVVRKVPTPTDVKYTVDNRTPMFSGNGVNGATIVITDATGSSVSVPDASVAAGTWSTRATTPWEPVNSRAINVVQKIGTETSDPVQIRVTIENLAPPTEVDYSVSDYTPTFTGKGIVGATIHVLDAGGNDVVPPLLLTTSNWTIRASSLWGPIKSLKVTVVHKQGGLSSTPVELNVTNPLLAPDISRVTVDELQAEVAGTCWAGAVLTLKFSDSADLHQPVVSNGTWVFERPTPFTPGGDYTVTAWQDYAELEPSPVASKTFTIKLPTPRITDPGDKAEVWRDFTVTGDKGYKGATMKLRNAQFGNDLGQPKVLTENGEWSIDLTGLDFRGYTIDAQQSLGQRESERSELRAFEVVLVPPIIEVPVENGSMPRTSTLSGWGAPGGKVGVWLKDTAEPLLENIEVDDDGCWKAEVTLPVGAKTIWARQTFGGRTSKDSQPLNYNVVPAAPVIETPVTGERIGRRVAVSGFGVAGDSVAVRLGDVAQTVLGRSPVLEDRTWSVTVEFDQPDGRYPLLAVASSEGFDSADSVIRQVVLGTYRPSVDVPAQGQWVSHPVEFKGQGRPGVGQVVSWFNPDHVWAPDLPVTGGGWQGDAQQSLPRGGQWCRFRQSLSDSADGATVSDWVESKRFESEPPTAES